MNANEFWSLDRDERRARIEHACDTGTCSVCGEPIVDGQPRNGLYHSHFDCTDLGEAPTADRFRQVADRCQNAIDALAENLRPETFSTFENLDKRGRHREKARSNPKRIR